MKSRTGNSRCCVSPWPPEPSRVPERSLAGEFSGYAAAFVEVEDGENVVLTRLTTPEEDETFTLSEFDSGTSTFSAELELKDRTIAFGGAGGLSAYVTDNWYAARTETPSKDGRRTEMAVVSGDLISKGLEGKFKDSKGVEVPVPGSYKHVKWGAFFGDRIGKDGEREHVHLGTFAAGKKVAYDVNELTKETITYRGHAIGNVSSGDQVYTSLGSYKDEFNFQTRKGKVSMDFDGRLYDQGNSSAGRLDDYRGSITTKAGDLKADLRGRFVGEATPVKGGKKAPGGLVGRFDIVDKNAKGYRATGTFGAEHGGN